MQNTNKVKELDQTDLKLLNLMTSDKRNDNKRLSDILGIPLSTIQRRVRSLVQRDLIISKKEINYKLLGFTQGVLHIYLSDGNLEELLKKISEIEFVTSLGVHVGNSDIVANIVYKEGIDLLNIIASIKKLPGVKGVVWSELILEYPVADKKLLSKLKT